MIKKLILSLALSVAFSAGAVTKTVTIIGSSSTNIPTVLGGGFTLLSATLISPANSNAVVTIYDAPGPSTNYQYSVGAYSNITSYVTNWINTWTNYYGVTNSVTNLALIDVTNNVSATTATYPLVFQWFAPTNSTVQFQNVNTRFNNGITVTNQNGAVITFIMQYTQ